MIASADYGFIDPAKIPDTSTIPESGDEVRVTRTIYDVKTGRILASVDSEGRQHRSFADAAGRTVKTIANFTGNGIFDPEKPEENITTEMRYDVSGNLLWQKDPLGNVTRKEYDAYGRLLCSIAPNGGRTVYEYDGAGRTVAVTDPMERTTRFEYDAKGRQVKTLLPKADADHDHPARETVYDEFEKRVHITDDYLPINFSSVIATSTPTQIGNLPDGMFHCTVLTYPPLPPDDHEPSDYGKDRGEPNEMDARTMHSYVSMLLGNENGHIGTYFVPHAAQGLQWYIDNTGDTRYISPVEFLRGSEDFRKLIFSRVTSLLKHLLMFSTDLFPAGTYIADNSWLDGIVNSPKDWFGIYRGYYYYLYALIVNHERSQATLNFHVTTLKYYNFDDKEYFGTTFDVMSLTGSNLNNMYYCGIAKNYDIWGHMAGTFELKCSPSFRISLERLQTSLENYNNWVDVPSVVPSIPGYRPNYS